MCGCVMYMYIRRCVQGCMAARGKKHRWTEHTHTYRCYEISRERRRKWATWHIKSFNSLNVVISVWVLSGFLTWLYNDSKKKKKRQEAAGWFDYAASRWERLSGCVTAHRGAGMCGGQEETDRDRAAVLSAGKKRGEREREREKKKADWWENHNSRPRAASHLSIFRSS